MGREEDGIDGRFTDVVQESVRRIRGRGGSR